MEKLLTVPELAARLQVSSGTIYHWLSQRKLGCTRIGRAVRFREVEDIQPFLKHQVPADGLRHGDESWNTHLKFRRR